MFEGSAAVPSRTTTTSAFLQREPSFARRRARCEGWLSLRGKDVRNREESGVRWGTGIGLWEQLFVDWVVDRAHLHRGNIHSGPFHRPLSGTCNTCRARVAPACSNRSSVTHTGYNVCSHTKRKQQAPLLTSGNYYTS